MPRTEPSQDKVEGAPTPQHDIYTIGRTLAVLTGDFRFGSEFRDTTSERAFFCVTIDDEGCSECIPVARYAIPEPNRCRAPRGFG